jgi:hypothetical protein
MWSSVTRLELQRWVFGTAIVALLALLCIANVHSATLLPNGKQQFISGAGVPLANGTVYMYNVNTTVCKNTWQDAAQTTLNACPIVLDANGEALIYGTGTYRQQVYACATPPTQCDNLTGLLQWDQVTTDTSASNSVFWAGQAGGTPNAITVTDAGFNGTDGSVIQFIPVANNTGATTLNPSAFGAISIVKDTASGAVALSGGEIVIGSPSNVVSMVYSASQNNFHLLNLVNNAAPQTQQTLCGATGLKIVNSVGTPNTQVTITADQVTTVNPSFQVVSRTNVSYTINITLGTVTATANGMDGEAPGTSAWINIWAIDNGTTGASLGALSAAAPTLPSGYSYKCRLGAMRVDGSGNLMRTLQLGARAQYTVVAGSNTLFQPLIEIGVKGTYSTTNPTWSVPSLSTFIPPTATQVQITAGNTRNAGGAANVIVAPTNAYNGAAGGLAQPIIAIPATTANNVSASVILEAMSIAWASDGTGGALMCDGWTDKVNAN